MHAKGNLALRNLGNLGQHPPNVARIKIAHPPGRERRIRNQALVDYLYTAMARVAANVFERGDEFPCGPFEDLKNSIVNVHKKAAQAPRLIGDAGLVHQTEHLHPVEIG